MPAISGLSGLFANEGGTTGEDPRPLLDEGLCFFAKIKITKLLFIKLTKEVILCVNY